MGRREERERVSELGRERGREREREKDSHHSHEQTNVSEGMVV